MKVFATEIFWGLPGWNEIAQGGAHFPLEVAHAGTTVDVRFAEASLQSDRRVTWSWTPKFRVAP